MKEEFLSVVYNSLEKEEFEIGWCDFIRKFKLERNEWLKSLYVERHMWAPPFMTDQFWAGMRSTQRIESMHSYFDQFVTRHTLLCEFGERYVACIEKRLEAEKDADEREGKFYRWFATGYAVENLFRKIYTSNKYKELRSECEKVTYCMVNETKVVDPNCTEFVVEDRIWFLKNGDTEKTLDPKRRRDYLVKFNPDSKIACCQCKMFETHGIMCRHLVRVYDKMHIEEVPEYFILRRWRRDVIREHTSVRVAFHDLSRTVEVKRLDRLVIAFDALSDVAVKSEKATQLVLSGFESLGVGVKLCLEEDEVVDPLLNSECDEMESQINANASQNSCVPPNGSVRDPPTPKKRGRPQTRIKGHSQTGWKPSKKYDSANNSGDTKKGKKCTRQAPNSPGIVESDEVIIY